MSAATEFNSEIAFFDAWTRGVEIAGPRWFKRDTWGATGGPSKWDYAPDYDAIEQSLGVLSTGEAAFLASMCSFYSPTGGRELMERLELGSPGSIAAVLDESRRRVIADLIISYSGW